MKHYVFYNQYGMILHMGYHYDDGEAWEGMFKECKYPDHAKNIEESKNLGIYFTKSS